MKSSLTKKIDAAWYATDDDLWLSGKDAQEMYHWKQVGYCFTEDSNGNLVGNFHEEKRGPGK